jgi:RNA polymerase sigma-70 factor (ECF subfamily)
LARRELAGTDVRWQWLSWRQEPERIDDEIHPQLAELAQAAARGDARAFAELVGVCAPRLFVLAARITGDPDEADDVLQEVFVRTHRALRSGELRQLASVSSWLSRATVRTSIDLLRARERGRRVRIGLGLALPASDPGQAEVRAAFEELRGWLSELPVEQRTVLVLKDLEGYTASEIASLLGISEGAVEQKLVRARATLRERGRREH